MIKFNKGLFLLCNEKFTIIVCKGDSSKDIPHSLFIEIGRSVISKEFRRLSSLRSFALDILHLFGFTDLTYKLFLYPEDYI